MNVSEFTDTGLVVGGQLTAALALAVHLLFLRPRGARRDLVLDARLIQDELELAERSGHITGAESVAVHQLLQRVGQNPRSAQLVLARIPELRRTVRVSAPQPDVEYLTGALDRLGDAGERYLRVAWPRAGALVGVPVAHHDVARDEAHGLTLQDLTRPGPGALGAADHDGVHPDGTTDALAGDEWDEPGDEWDAPGTGWPADPDDVEDPGTADPAHLQAGAAGDEIPSRPDELDLREDLDLRDERDPRGERDLRDEPNENQDADRPEERAVRGRAGGDRFERPARTTRTPAVPSPSWIDLVTAETKQRRTPTRTGGPAATRTESRAATEGRPGPAARPFRPSRPLPRTSSTEDEHSS